MFSKSTQLLLKQWTAAHSPQHGRCFCPARHFSNTNTAKTISSSLSDSVINNAVDDKRPLPREAKVVICGAGVMGASVAYHLAELGWGPNTVLIDQGK